MKKLLSAGGIGSWSEAKSEMRNSQFKAGLIEQTPKKYGADKLVLTAPEASKLQDRSALSATYISLK